MKYYPNCKINIGLSVVRKRPDGYHDLETIFYPVKGLCDELEVNPLPADSEQDFCFVSEGIEVDCPVEDNLIYRCFRMMREKYPAVGPVEVRFLKNIPFGAGLGGGSSDATHMAIALNDLFHLGLSRKQIAADVRVLGADCPFFAYNVPCFAEGIGDILTPIDLNLKGLRLVMIKPDVHVSTREAYSGVVPHSDSDLKSLDWKQTTNDFEKSVFLVHPELAEIKKRLLDAGAVYAAMSGSGSTVFGLFEQDAEGGSTTDLRMLEQELSSVIIFNDTLTEA